MKIITYNVNGLRAAVNKGLPEWLAEENPDVLCLQETKLQPEQYPAEAFEALGYKIYATRSTAKYLQEHGVNALRVNKISQESPNVMDLILGHKIDLVIDTPTQGNGDKTRDGFLIRRNAIETGVYCITAMDTANALARSLETAMDTLTPVDIAKVKNL